MEILPQGLTRDSMEVFVDEDSAATIEQVLPKGKGADVCTLVKTDLEDRVALGVKRYGERLTSHNGRDALTDLYQEILDAAVYIRQVLYERDNK